MKITVVYAVLKDSSLTLITNTGESHKIPQGDVRLRPLLDEVIPALNAGQTIEVDLSQGAVTNAYEEFEQKSNGVLRFFRIAKEKLKSWFGSDSLAVADGSYGTIPDTKVDTEVQERLTNPEQREQTLQELIASSKPVTGLVFNTGNTAKELGSDETMIAVVDNKSVIANVENLHAQVAHANKIGSAVALENFSRHVAAVPRQHSMEDLISFIKKLDTPLTNDGYVLAYKNLKYIKGDVYADPYTGKVKQGVGTRVCMNESLVDPNRGQDCSNGLHIASRSYLRSYTASGTFLVRIKPSDVIAVPKYNTNKMRVCAYEILGQLNSQDQKAVFDNRPLSSEEGKTLLAKAIAGHIPPMVHQAEITASHGGGVIYTRLDQDNNSIAETREFEQDSLEDLGMVDPIDPDVSTEQITAPVVPVEEVAAVIETAKLSRKEQAKALYATWVALVEQGTNIEAETKALDALHKFKKAAKVHWDRLDIPNEDGEPIIVHRDESEEASIPTVNEAAENFDKAVKPDRLDYEDSVKLEDFFEEFMNADYESKAEYDAAVKLVKLFNESNFQFDEDGICEDLTFGQGEFEDAEKAIEKWEQKALLQKLAPAPEKPAEPAKVETATDVPAKAPSYREQIRALLKTGPLTIGVAKDIMAIKKSAKKGWSALGVNADEAFDIEQQAKTE